MAFNAFFRIYNSQLATALILLQFIFKNGKNLNLTVHFNLPTKLDIFSWDCSIIQI